jgi:hypothetical protein
MRSRHFHRAVTSLIVLWALVPGASPASAQGRGIEAGGHVNILRLSELETTDVGVGAGVLWPVTSVLAIDGALTWFPAVALAADGFESQRALGLAGGRVVARRRDIELFAGARAGFLRFVERDPVVCIAIFPAPLSCQLAAGYTAFAADFGGGASVGLAQDGRLRAHVEAGDLLVRYGLEAFRPRGETTDGFISHNFSMTFSLRWRFD